MPDEPTGRSLDAGPGLNFLSINKERLLIGVLGQISAPETVQAEVFRKSRQDERFKPAEKVWRRLTPRWLQILPDEPTPERAAVVHRITQLPIERRLKQPKDLGEIMVTAHAVVAAEAGASVTVLIDDGTGARIATAETNRLERLRAGGAAVGSIMLASTHTILARAQYSSSSSRTGTRCAISTAGCEVRRQPAADRNNRSPVD